MATIKKAQTGIKKDSVKERKTNLDGLKKKVLLDERLKNLANNEKQYVRQSVVTPKKKMKNGGSLSGLTASNKRDKGTDVGGAWTTVQKKILAGAKDKAKLTKDKQLGATKMTAKRGMKISKKK